MYNGNCDITRTLDQSNLTTQRCRLIFWVECSVGGYLVLAKAILSLILILLYLLAHRREKRVKICLFFSHKFTNVRAFTFNHSDLFFFFVLFKKPLLVSQTHRILAIRNIVESYKE
jgi:hypothetical protein